MTQRIIEIVDYHQQQQNKQIFYDKKIPNMVPKCRIPWNTLIVNQEGVSYICISPAWLPKSIGRILDVNNIYDLLNSDEARAIRSEIYNGSYSYCNTTLCSHGGKWAKPYTNPTTLLTKDEFVSASTVTNLPTAIIFDFDYTCNFLCPSCRTEIVNENTSNITSVHDALVQHIKTVLLDEYKNTTAHTTFRWAGGEPFVSNAYLQLWEYIATFNNPNLKHKIQTNGSYIHKRVPLLIKMLPTIEEISISVDAGTEDTYTKLRVNGNWQVLKDNCILARSIIDSNGADTLLKSSFVTQLDNYQEIPEYVDLMFSMGFDNVSIDKMWNWGRTTDAEFERINITNPLHKDHAKLLAILDTVKNIPGVLIGI